YTAGQVAAGAGKVWLGSEFFHYQTATQLSTSPNRWRLSGLSNRGANCSTAGIGTHAIGDKFVWLDDPVKFVEIEVTEIGVARNFKPVTSGQNINSVSPVSVTINAPNFTITTPGDYNVAFDAGRNELIH